MSSDTPTGSPKRQTESKPPRQPPSLTDAIDEDLELHTPVQDVYQPPTYFYYSRFLPSSDLPKYLDAVPDYLRPALFELAAYQPPVDDFGLPDRRAAVCVAVHVAETPQHAQEAGEPPFRLEVWLTRRAAKMRTHSGEVALPGGRVDKEDRDPTHTALREAHEEIGLPPNLALMLTQLPPTMSRQHLLVTPVVFLLVHNLDPERKRRPFLPIPNPSEVASVFSTPLLLFLRSKGHGHRDMDWPDTGWKMRSHFWDFDTLRREGVDIEGEREFPPKERQENGEFVFGLTAGIMLSVVSPRASEAERAETNDGSSIQARLALPHVEPEFTIDRDGAPSEHEKISYLQKGGKFGPGPPIVVKTETSQQAGKL
jgi:8-oxo-dGTP pyrophosphatase MutT (NUDIX family)